MIGQLFEKGWFIKVGGVEKGLSIIYFIKKTKKFGVSFVYL